MSHTPGCVCVECEDRLRAAAPDLLEALKEADTLLLTLVAVINNEAIEDHLPFGLKDKANQWLRSGRSTTAIAKASPSPGAQEKKK
jgi:hypothetical protein